MPVTGGLWIAAVLPMAVLLVLMAVCRWGAIKAAPLGMALAAVMGAVVFRADGQLLLLEGAKGVWSALSVLAVIFPAILLYEISSSAGVFRAFQIGMKKLIPNELLQILMMAWVFPSFLQGISGFGVPVAVGAPLLMGIGVTPLWAVILPPIGHSWGNTYGTLAIAWEALVSSTDLTADPALYVWTAVWATGFIWLWNLACGFLICFFYGGRRALKKGWPAVLLISALQGGGQTLVAQLNASLACFLPCCFALAAALLLGRTKRYRTPWSVPDSKIMRRKEPEAGEEAVMSLHQAFFPSYVMTVIALCVLLIPPLKSFLSQWQISFSFPETVTGYGYVNAAVAAYSPITPLTHAGLFLLIAAAAGFVYYRRKGFLKRARLGIWRRTWRKAVPSGAAITCFIVLSRLMSGTGQTDVLAKGIAGVLGGTYVLLVPMVGMLGSFITSSNMSSNVLFASFQMTTAALLGVSQAAFLGAQTAGGAIGSILCPGNIVLGTTTAGVLGQEGLVLRKLLPIAVAAAAVLGVLLCIALYIL